MGGAYVRDQAVPGGCRAGAATRQHFYTGILRLRCSLGTPGGLGWLHSVQVPEGTWGPAKTREVSQLDRCACLPPRPPEPTWGAWPRARRLFLSSSAGQPETSAHAAPPVGVASGSGRCAVWRPRATCCGRCPRPGVERWPSSQPRWTPAAPSPAPPGEHGVWGRAHVRPDPGRHSLAGLVPALSLPFLSDPFP